MVVIYLPLLPLSASHIVVLTLLNILTPPLLTKPPHFIISPHLLEQPPTPAYLKEYEDLDEIIARYVSPISSFARDIIGYKYYQSFDGGNQREAEKFLQEEKAKAPAKFVKVEVEEEVEVEV